MTWTTIKNFIINAWNNNFIRILVTTLLFIFFWWLFSLIIKKLKKRALKRKTDRLVTIVVFNLILWGVRIGLIIIYASIVGIDMAGFAALIASAGVAIGLAIQGSLSNLAGGIVLVLTRPFQLGDYIEAQGVGGSVEEIKLFYTHIITPDNKVIMIPNGTLANGVITNFSKKNIRRVDLIFSISYEDNVKKAIGIVEEVCRNNKLILSLPTTFVGENAQSSSSVDIVVKVWCNTENYWTVYYDLIRDVHEAFDKNQITIPYPQIDVHTK